MRSQTLLRLGLLLALASLGCPVHAAGAPDSPAPADQGPSPAAVADLLRSEPIALATWPAWRGRLLAWMPVRNHHADAAYESARAFIKSQANNRDEMPPALAQDALAWYLLGSAFLYQEKASGNPQAVATRAERALRRSLQLDPNFARAHRNLAMALFLQEGPGDPTVKWRVNPSGPQRISLDPRAPQREAERELAEARRLDPSLPLKGVEGQAAFLQKRFAVAAQRFTEALAEEPDEVQYARGAAMATLLDPQRSPSMERQIKSLRDRFPDDGPLTCMHAAALAATGDSREAARSLERARSLGTDPNDILGKELVTQIEAAAAPGWLERAAWILGGFVAVYAVAMLLMAGFGVLLAGFTRGSRALDLLSQRPDELVSAGQVARSRHESVLARLYGYALVAGLILFYAAIPFVIAGLLAATGVLLYLIFSLGRIPIKLVAIVVVVGGGAAWAVLKSLFARPAPGSFGIKKSAEDCPRLHEALAKVARRVDTDPVDEIYVAPGSSIGVHQEGRGPFGIFGVKRRVLTLGLSTMRFLTIGELQAILAHEYAHFSHKDTFYSRFIYQVTLSIQEALKGMGETGGSLNYVNPFYWFMVLYYKSYTLLSAGFSRSREFLADRMAALCYGSDVFSSALTKVCTDGSLFEMTIYDNIAQLLEQEKAFVNMYEAFRNFREEQLQGTDPEELYKKLLEEKASLFASHPTFGERIEAVSGLPRADRPETAPALELFEKPEEIERELTEFLTGFIYHVRRLQAEAAAAQG